MIACPPRRKAAAPQPRPPGPGLVVLNIPRPRSSSATPRAAGAASRGTGTLGPCPGTCGHTTQTQSALQGSTGCLPVPVSPQRPRLNTPAAHAVLCREARLPGPGLGPAPVASAGRPCSEVAPPVPNFHTRTRRQSPEQPQEEHRLSTGGGPGPPPAAPPTIFPTPGGGECNVPTHASAGSQDVGVPWQSRTAPQSLGLPGPTSHPRAVLRQAWMDLEEPH